METPTKTDVAIVGGGLAGLTAATYLARAGVDVTVYEKASTLGGRAATQNHDGYKLNLGIHALYCGGATEHVLRELNIPYSGGTPDYKKLSVLKQGTLFLTPLNAMSLLRTKLFSLADKLELMKALSSLPKIQAHTLRHMSVQAWINRTAQRPAVREFLMANAITGVYSSALDLVSAELLITRMQMIFNNPIIYIDGGWQSFVDGLRGAAKQAGAKVVSGQRVEAVDYRDGRAVGVRLNGGGVVNANAVILTGKPEDVVKLVDGGNYLPLRHIVDGLIAPQVACLDVMLSRLPDPQHAVVQDLAGGRFMSAQSVYSKVAPDGGAIIYSVKFLDPRTESDPKADERELETFLDTVQPGWRDVLVKRQYLPRIDALGALPTARDGGFAGRPSPQVPGIDGLYMAGDWIGAEGFLADASFASAKQVATLVQRDLRRAPARPAVKLVV